ncbi:MAG: pyridoxamine 5'-phosphate oxidase family protein, partial [Dehalococcoidia bacterium]
SLREATAEEMEMWQKKVGFLRATKGYKIMWEGMHHVRDVKFDSYEPIYLAEMTQGTVNH